MLSEVPKPTVKTLLVVNKLLREVCKEASQAIWFPACRKPWQEIAKIVWSDASQGDRPNKASTVGYIGGYAPVGILHGSAEGVAVVAWKSSKAPHESLGSNGAEVQAITVGEDVVFLLRALWCEIHGGAIGRHGIESEIAKHTYGGLVTDSRGVYDAMTRNLSSLHGLRSSRAGLELTFAAQQALRLGTQLRWVNGMAMLAMARPRPMPRSPF